MKNYDQTFFPCTSVSAPKTKNVKTQWCSSLQPLFVSYSVFGYAFETAFAFQKAKSQLNTLKLLL